MASSNRAAMTDSMKAYFISTPAPWAKTRSHVAFSEQPIKAETGPVLSVVTS